MASVINNTIFLVTYKFSKQYHELNILLYTSTFRPLSRGEKSWSYVKYEINKGKKLRKYLTVVFS